MSSLVSIKTYSIFYSVISSLYLLILTEKKYSILFERGAFLLNNQMSLVEKVVFVFFLFLQIFLFYVVVLFFVGRLCRILRWTLNVKLFSFVFFVIFICYATADYKVYTYFKDLLSYELLKSMGGGSVVNSIYYIVSEIYDTAQYSLFVLLVFIFIGWYVKSKKWSIFSLYYIENISRQISILYASVVFVSFVICGAFLNFPVYSHLNKIFVTKHLLSMMNILTDFDLDGYSMTTVPRDDYLFDSTMHPYAIDFPDNGIDENSVGGDLVSIVKPQPFHFTKNEPVCNLVLVVCESMRGDLHNKKFLNEYVLNNMRSVVGQDFQVLAHTAFTTPSVTSILSGTLSLDESAPSIFEILKKNLNNINVGVFSGQSEAFGGLESRNKMKLADVFFDSRSGGLKERMYLGTNDASLKMPGGVVAGSFKKWLDSVPNDKPFFSYVNLQELHFPYNSEKIENKIIKNKISRNDISLKTKNELEQTYLNAARQLDEYLIDIVNSSRTKKSKYNTVVVIVGDHGEELYDHGILGHGTKLSFEQNSAYMKIVGMERDLPMDYFYQKQLQRLIYSIIVGDLRAFGEYYRQSLKENFIYVGNIKYPREVGKLIDGSIVKYDFYRKKYHKQSAFGGDFTECEEAPDVVVPWESYMHALKKL